MQACATILVLNECDLRMLLMYDACVSLIGKSAIGSDRCKRRILGCRFNEVRRKFESAFARSDIAPQGVI